MAGIHPLLPNNVRDARWRESLQPRVSRMGDGTLITLRCINGGTNVPISWWRCASIWMMGLSFPLASVKCWRWMTW